MTAASTARSDPRPFKAALFGLPSAALAVFLLWPAAGRTESSLASASGKASASIHFRIVVPPTMRILENSHPSQLEASADGALVGQQRLVVVSNMKHGFCVALRRNQAEAGPWQLETAAHSGAALTTTADGYRLCTSRPGRYSLLLQHRFQPTATATATLTALAWPVQTDITAL